jgi:tripartite-type tricarboxylate transporter receptor subunit TctC
MITKNRSFMLVLLFAAVAMGSFERAAAQVYPSHPIKIVVPYPAGGVSDVLMRVIAERMRQSLGQPVIIENVTGAAGNIGVGRVARAGPDGYTLVQGNWSTHVANGAVYSLQYDLLKDFAPVGLIASNPILIAAKKGIPVDTLRDLIVWLKANPGKASQGTNGFGSIMHLAGLFFQKETGTRFAFVPYRGGPATMNDLLSGNIDLYLGPAGEILTQQRAGGVKVFAVMAKGRMASAPDIPSVDEAGAAGLYVSAWWGLWAPKDTPKEVIAKLNAAIVDALADPVVRTQLAKFELDIPPREQQSPEMLGAFQKAEIDKWWPIIKEAGIKPE